MKILLLKATILSNKRNKKKKENKYNKFLMNIQIRMIYNNNHRMKWKIKNKRIAEHFTHIFILWLMGILIIIYNRHS
jgi:hypothetical protein